MEEHRERGYECDEKSNDDKQERGRKTHARAPLLLRRTFVQDSNVFGESLLTIAPRYHLGAVNAVVGGK